jgi:hypothetical protein
VPRETSIQYPPQRKRCGVTHFGTMSTLSFIFSSSNDGAIVNWRFVDLAETSKSFDFVQTPSSVYG